MKGRLGRSRAIAHPAEARVDKFLQDPKSNAEVAVIMDVTKNTARMGRPLPGNPTGKC